MSGAKNETEKRPFQEPKARHHAFDVPSWLRVARDHHEGGTYGVVRDVATLAFGPGRSKPYEYFFMGDRARVVLHRQVIESEWLAATYDKLLFPLAMRGRGLPVPMSTRSIIPVTTSLMHGV